LVFSPKRGINFWIGGPKPKKTGLFGFQINLAPKNGGVILLGGFCLMVGGNPGDIKGGRTFKKKVGTKPYLRGIWGGPKK